MVTARNCARVTAKEKFKYYSIFFIFGTTEYSYDDTFAVLVRLVFLQKFEIIRIT